MRGATVYTETVVWAPTEQYLNDVPYQLAILQLDEGKRLTGRIAGDRVSVGDRVEFVEERYGVPYFKRA